MARGRVFHTSGAHLMSASRPRRKHKCHTIKCTAWLCLNCVSCVLTLPCCVASCNDRYLAACLKPFDCEGNVLACVADNSVADTTVLLATCRCLSHLQQLLPLPGDAEQPLTWIDCTNNTNLLTVTNKEDVLDFRSISGTSDIAIVTAASREMSWERKGLCILFELKKPQSMNSKALHQALCQLVLANLVCGELKPVVVLTDLQESWRLLWMAGSTAKVASFTSSAAALAAIDGCIVQASALAAYKQPTCPPGLPLDIAKREPAAFPAGPAVEGDVGNLADLEGFLPDEEVAYARGAALLQRFFADEGACLVQPAPGPAPPGMYA